MRVGSAVIALAAWSEWLPVPLLRRTIKHGLGYVIAIGFFYWLREVTKRAVPVEWLRDWLDATHIVIVLTLAGLLALEYLVPLARDIWRGMRNGE